MRLRSEMSLCLVTPLSTNTIPGPQILSLEQDNKSIEMEILKADQETAGLLISSQKFGSVPDGATADTAKEVEDGSALVSRCHMESE